MKPEFISSSINTFCNFLQTEIKGVTGRMQFLGGQRLTLDIGIVQLLYSGRKALKRAFLGSTLEKYLQKEPSERSTLRNSIKTIIEENDSAKSKVSIA